MINKVQIRGFRKHKKLSIEFGPNVNSIIGPSYAGKSTIIRALLWSLQNKPAGTSVINWDKEQAAVRTTIDKNHITRTRNKTTKNTYELDDKKFIAFGNDLPDEIRNCINMSKINWQGQHDSPFWFCETAGEVSRQLNAIIDLNIIDSTLANLASSLRSEKGKIDVSKDRLKTIGSKCDDLAYINAMDVDLEEIEKQEAVYLENARKRSLLDDLIKRAILYGSQQEHKREAANTGDLAISRASESRNISKSIETLQNLIETAQEAKEQAKREIPSYQHIETLQHRLSYLTDDCDSLNDILDLIETQEQTLCETKEKLKARETKLKKELKNRCPVCKKLLMKKS